MRRADRLFDVIQVLRTAKKPVTAAALAEELEVTVRTIYRDVATLQARRVPIEGAPGLGYVLRKGFDLPPLMFTVDEIEAITVGALVQRVRDSELQHAAARVLDKVTVVLPESLRSHLADAPFYVSRGDAVEPKVDVAQVRAAIRDRRKMRIAYVDEKGHRTRRTIWPLAMAYYVDVAWSAPGASSGRTCAISASSASPAHACWRRASRITTASCSPNGWRCPRSVRSSRV